MPLYCDLATKGVDYGAVAYRDFECQYPPVAWWLMMVPRLTDPQPFVEPNPSREAIKHYVWWNFGWIHAIFFAADLVCVVLMYLIGRQYSALAQWGLPAAYTLVTLAQPHLLYERLDIVLTMFLLLWTYCSLRSLRRSAAGDLWAVAGYLFLGLGISYKLVPLVCVPFVLLAEIWGGRLWRLALGTIALAIAAVGPFLLQMRTSGRPVLEMFQYHSEREINLESTWASLMLAMRPLGFLMDVIFSHGGYDLTGPWRGEIKMASSLSLFAARYALLGLWALWRGRRFDRRTARDIGYLALINSMVLSHVFSPQYLNWTLPIAILLALDTFPRRWSAWCLLGLLFAVILGISSWIFPKHHIELRELQPLATNLSIARSACLVALSLLLNAAFFRSFGLLRLA